MTNPAAPMVGPEHARATLARLLGACVVVGALGASAAPLPPAARAEVVALLSRLEASGCRFQRNGTWHAGSEAKAHLMQKLDYVEKYASVASAEAYIALAASKSSVSGEPYLVKCATTDPLPSAVWLTQELKALRAARAPPGSK